MSVAEMKLAAIKSISKLEDESAVKEILDHLNRLESQNQHVLTTLGHAAAIIEERRDVLKKLAQ